MHIENKPRMTKIIFQLPISPYEKYVKKVSVILLTGSFCGFAGNCTSVSSSVCN